MQALITDFFSHKIHASEPGWANRLCAIANIFNRYNGQRYDQCKNLLMQEFKEVAPRISAIRDNPQFRDEITAYVSYLGVTRFRYERDAWVIETPATVKKFLLEEAPDVGAFLRLQLSLFQYPNGMGVAHLGRGRVQRNAAKKSWNFVKAGAHISPIRLLSVALLADAELRSINLLSAQVSARELYALANHEDIYPFALPPKNVLLDVLRQIRSSRVKAPSNFETRFHILNHTQIFESHGEQVGFCQISKDTNSDLLLSRFQAIAEIDSQFDEFDECKNEDELEQYILSGAWENYFDALNRLPGQLIHNLTQNAPTAPFPQTDVSSFSFPLRKFDKHTRPYTEIQEDKDSLWKIASDPEVVRIKCERRNITHALMVSRLLEWLEDCGNVLEVGDSQHIDLWAKLPDGRVFIFEIKSGGDNFFEQIRKGVSQLYEYRYRYSKTLEEFKEAQLCLVLPSDPLIKWLPDYLCRDRIINLCVHSLDTEEPVFHQLCQNKIDFTC